MVGLSLHVPVQQSSSSEDFFSLPEQISSESHTSPLYSEHVFRFSVSQHALLRPAQ